MKFNGFEIDEVKEIVEGKEYLLWNEGDCCAVVGRVIGMHKDRFITVYNEGTDKEDCRLFGHCGLIPWDVTPPKMCMTPAEILMKFELQGNMILSHEDIYEPFALDLNRKDCLYSIMTETWFTPKEARDCGYRFLDGNDFMKAIG